MLPVSVVLPIGMSNFGMQILAIMKTVPKGNKDLKSLYEQILIITTRKESRQSSFKGNGSTSMFQAQTLRTCMTELFFRITSLI